MENTLIHGQGQRRVCYIQRGETGFGFILCCENDTTDTYVLHVLYDSPACKANLLPGDKIIEVNGLNVEKESHKDVVERLQGLPSVKLAVVHSTTAEEYFRKPDNGMTVKPLENCDESLRPKLIRVERASASGFDFVLQTVGKSKRVETGRYRQQLKGIAGHYTASVNNNGLAHDAGLRTGHRLIEINDLNIEKESHAFVVAKIKASKSLELLVVDDETDQFFRRHGVSPTSKHLRGQLEFGGNPGDDVTAPRNGSAPGAAKSASPYISAPVLLPKPNPIDVINGYDVRGGGRDVRGGRDVIAPLPNKPIRKSMSFMKKFATSTPDLTFGSKKKEPGRSGSFFGRLNRHSRSRPSRSAIDRQKSDRIMNDIMATRNNNNAFKRDLYDDMNISDDVSELSIDGHVTPNGRRRLGSHSSPNPVSDSGSNFSDISSTGATLGDSRWAKSMLNISSYESPPPAYRTHDDRFDFKVDLNTLKARVREKSERKKSGPKMTDYTAAYRELSH